MNRKERRSAGERNTKITIVAGDLPDMGSARLFPYIDETNKIPVGHILVFEPFIFETDKLGEKTMTGIDRGQCIVWDTIVAPEYRGQGMGETMLNALKEIYDVMLSGARSEAGQALAEKCGFQLTNDGRYFWRKDGKYAEGDARQAKEASKEKGIIQKTDGSLYSRDDSKEEPK